MSKTVRPCASILTVILFLIALVLMSSPVWAIDINACGTITTPGEYFLQADLTTPIGGNCITVSTSGHQPTAPGDFVIVRGNGHTITTNFVNGGGYPIYVVNSPATQIVSFTLRSWNSSMPMPCIFFYQTDTTPPYQIYAGSNSLYGCGIHMGGVSNYSAGFNTIYGGVLSILDSGNSSPYNSATQLIAGNNITAPAQFTVNNVTPGGIYSSGISIRRSFTVSKTFDITIVANTIDGSWTGSSIIQDLTGSYWAASGVENGISIFMPCDGCVIGTQQYPNTVRNVFGAAVEFLGAMKNLTVEYNNFYYFGMECFLAAYDLSQDNSLFNHNNCDASGAVNYAQNSRFNQTVPVFLQIAGTRYLLPDGSTGQWRNVRFTNNTFRSPVNVSNSHDLYMTSKANTAPGTGGPMNLTFSGTNTWSGNTFYNTSKGTKYVLYDVPPEAIVDGGGNTCAYWVWYNLPSPPYPITCN